METQRIIETRGLIIKEERVISLTTNLFDAALGIIWKIEGLVDIVRIYDKKNDPERIKTIRDRYLAEINHLQK